MNAPLTPLLRSLSACSEAVTWSADRTVGPEAWDACERPDWLFWLAVRAGVDRRVLVRAACACARHALRHVPVGELRPLCAIEVTEAWTLGEATVEQVREARRAALDYRAAAAATYAAADAATYAAAAAADATYAAAAATYAAADAAADRSQARREIAVLVRAVIPWRSLPWRAHAWRCGVLGSVS